MTSFTFSAEQLSSAPLAVRQWIESEVATTLRALMGAPQDAPPGHSAELAACTPEEALEVFELIRENFATSLVFLELAREPVGKASPTLDALSIGDMIRHTRLTESRLVACLQTINQIFQQLRNDPEAMLFGFDQANHVYIHETTHRSVRNLWEGLMRAPAISAAPPPIAPPPGFTLPQVGPSEDIAAHSRT